MGREKCSDQTLCGHLGQCRLLDKYSPESQTTQSPGKARAGEGNPPPLNKEGLSTSLPSQPPLPLDALGLAPPRFIRPVYLKPSVTSALSL